MRAASLITMALLGLTAGILVAPYLPGRRDRAPEREPAGLREDVPQDRGLAALAVTLRDLESAVRDLRRATAEHRASAADHPEPAAPERAASAPAVSANRPAEGGVPRDPLRAAYEARRDPIDLRKVYKDREEAKRELFFLGYADVIQKVGAPNDVTAYDNNSVLWSYDGFSISFWDGHVYYVEFVE